MIDYDSFSHCHLTDIFFAIFAGAKELNSVHRVICYMSIIEATWSAYLRVGSSYLFNRDIGQNLCTHKQN